MTLDEVEKLARGLQQYGISADAAKAAEMVLMMLPVVKAAEAWAESHRPWNHPAPKPLSAMEHPFRDERDLFHAIDQMRLALGGK